MVAFVIGMLMLRELRLVHVVDFVDVEVAYVDPD
jgi:hypothetical protein